MQQDVIGKRDLGVSRDYCDPISSQGLRPRNASATACSLPFPTHWSARGDGG
jgi:hypothetical protein